ncbi:MAG: hypothetical protein WC360_02880 [Opitutales bacterium]|jgi:hypothetical protein
MFGHLSAYQIDRVVQKAYKIYAMLKPIAFRYVLTTSLSLLRRNWKAMLVLGLSALLLKYILSFAFQIYIDHIYSEKSYHGELTNVVLPLYYFALLNYLSVLLGVLTFVAACLFCRVLLHVDKPVWKRDMAGILNWKILLISVLYVSVPLLCHLLPIRYWGLFTISWAIIQLVFTYHSIPALFYMFRFPTTGIAHAYKASFSELEGMRWKYAGCLLMILIFADMVMCMPGIASLLFSSLGFAGTDAIALLNIFDGYWLYYVYLLIVLPFYAMTAAVFFHMLEIRSSNAMIRSSSIP